MNWLHIEADSVIKGTEMSKFIEVDIANTDSKTFVNVDQIVNVGRYKLNSTGYIHFNSSGGAYENCIHTKQSYEELKNLILNSN